MTMTDQVIAPCGDRIRERYAGRSLSQEHFRRGFIGPRRWICPNRRGGALIAGTRTSVATADLWRDLGAYAQARRLGREDGVAGSVESVEYLGADSLLACRVGDQPLTVRVSGRIGLQHGDKVRLGWANAAAHFFDGATQTRREVAWNHQPATMVA